MLTIFTIPKPFIGHIEVIQRNAIESWLRLRPTPEVILCGDDKGVAEVAVEYGVQHVPNISKTEYGTPLVSASFAAARQLAKTPYLMYSNADIIYLDGLIEVIQQIKFKHFMLVSGRWDIDITERLDVTVADYNSHLKRRIQQQATLHAPLGSDWFAYPVDTPIDMPPFAVGRPAWDNWLLRHMIEQDIPLINVSPRYVWVIHQNHDYAHIPQGDFSKAWESPEADQNYKIFGDRDWIPLLRDSSHIITRTGQLVPLPPVRWRRRAREAIAKFRQSYHTAKTSWRIRL